MKRGKEEHEKALQNYIKKCQNKIIDLAAKSPDAIEAVYEDGVIKLIAIEVLPVRWNKSKSYWKKTFTHKQKEESYRMFDKVKIINYKLQYSKPENTLNSN